MKTTIVGGIITLIVALIIWSLNQERFDVRYTLSDQIPLAFGAAQQEEIQQLEVKNLGRSQVESVQVKIPSTVSQYQLSKHSEADDTKIFQNPDKFELVYGALPPQGSFRLVFKTSAPGVSKKDIQVRHSKGIAEEALSNTSDFDTFILSALKLVFPLGFIGFFLWTLRDVGINSWEHAAKYKCEKVLLASSPFYISKGKWRELRETAIENFGGSRDWQHKDATAIEASLLYTWLNNPKPISLSDEEWLTFRAKKKREFLEPIIERLNRSWTKAGDLISLLRLPRPQHVPTEEWSTLEKELHKKFVAAQADEIMDSLRAGTKVVAPSDVDRQLWSLVEEKVSKRRYLSLAESIDFKTSPLEFLQNENLSMLTEEHKAALWDRARERIQGRLNRTIQVILTEILRGTPLTEEALDHLDEDWKSRLRAIDHDVRWAREKNVSDAEENEASKRQVEEMKGRVIKQLAVIDRLLADPSSVDRVEPYDNPFTPGNLEMLKRVARLLSEKSQP